MKLITKVSNIFSRLDNYLAVMAIVLIVFLMLSITYNVVARYFWGSMTTGLFEIWEYTLLYIPFLGAAWLLERDGHVSVDIVIDYLKPGVRAVIRIITSSLGAAVCLVLTWFGTQVTGESFQAGYQVRGEIYTPEFIILMVIPVGSFLLFIQFLRKTYQYSTLWNVMANKEQRL